MVKDAGHRRERHLRKEAGENDDDHDGVLQEAAHSRLRHDSGAAGMAWVPRPRPGATFSSATPAEPAAFRGSPHRRRFLGGVTPGREHPLGDGKPVENVWRDREQKPPQVVAPVDVSLFVRQDRAEFLIRTGIEHRAADHEPRPPKTDD